MKKLLIGSLVGAIIMFLCGFIFWAVSPMHVQTYLYTPAQDSILKILADNNVESGAYMMPMTDNRNVTDFGKYQEESHKYMEGQNGKPFVTMYYLKEGLNMNMGLGMLCGFLINFLAVFAACIILAPAFAAMSSFFGRWWLVLLIGAIIALCGPLVSYNWMGSPWSFAKEMVLDYLLNWGITGIWLAWYFKNK